VPRTTDQVPTPLARSSKRRVSLACAVLSRYHGPCWAGLAFTASSGYSPCERAAAWAARCLLHSRSPNLPAEERDEPGDLVERRDARCASMCATRFWFHVEQLSDLGLRQAVAFRMPTRISPSCRGVLTG